MAHNKGQKIIKIQNVENRYIKSDVIREWSMESILTNLQLIIMNGFPKLVPKVDFELTNFTDKT